MILVYFLLSRKKPEIEANMCKETVLDIEETTFMKITTTESSSFAILPVYDYFLAFFKTGL